MKKKIDEKKYSTPTRLIYGKAVSTEWDYSYHVIPPITASSTFRLGSAERGAKGFEAIGAQVAMGFPDPIYVYDRMGEPNNNLLQNSLAIAENAEAAVTYATGMSAVHAAVTFALGAGSEVISHKLIYGCTFSLFENWFPRFQIPVHFCDLRQPDAFLQFVNENTRVLYLESPANPTLDLIDLAAVAKLVKEINAKRGPNRQIITIIDNTFATPWCQRPIELGIDVVVHSLTKGISGFGTEMGAPLLPGTNFSTR